MGSYFSKSTVSDPSEFATLYDGVEISSSNEAQQIWKAYDYVIVGAGAAGCVLANRLSADPETSVLLIEAGSSNVGLTASQIPCGFPKLFKTKNDWQYHTTPQSRLNNPFKFVAAWQGSRRYYIDECPSISSLQPV